MPVTPDAGRLRYAVEEALSLSERLPEPTLLVEDDVTAVGEHTPTRDRVRAQLAEAAIAHFVCHASSDPDDPFLQPPLPA